VTAPRAITWNERGGRFGGHPVQKKSAGDHRSLCQTHGFPGPVVREICYLQLRMLCELIALACLVAHGDISTALSSRLRKAYEADKILAQLEALFYAQPVRQLARPEGGWNLEIIQTSTFLSKAELLALYAKSGAFLHRGSFKNLMSSQAPIVINLPEIVRWAQKIHDLLAIHVVALLGGEHGIVCMLRNADDADHVQEVFIERRPPVAA
jgi:hypothetical protein